MNVVVFHNLANAHYVTAIESMLILEGCAMRVVRVSEVFDREKFPNPLHAFEGISHMVYLHDGDAEERTAFAFLAGYALGRNIKVILLEFSERFRISENCRHLGIVMNPDQFEGYLVLERVRFRAEEARKSARETLLQRGISVFPENFAAIVAAGDSDSVRLFIEAGFEPNMADSRGNPLLTLAVRSQFPEVAKILLDAGADVNRLSGDRGYSPLMDAAQKGDQAMAELLLARGAEADIRSKDGQTALIVCAGRGDVSLCKLLIAHGADPLIGDKLGMTATSYAKLFNNQELLALFNPSPA